jgi:hypothetical protein
MGRVHDIPYPFFTIKRLNKKEENPMAKKSSLRKCHFTLCDFPINIDKDETIKTDKNFYHFDCYVNYLITKKKMSKVEAELLAKPLYQETLEYLKTEKDKSKLIQFIQKQYDMVFLPKYLYTKLDAIYKGEFKGMSKSIMPCELLEIWDRKFPEFVKFNSYKRSKGEVIEGIGRINYDLAIVLSKYDSFKKWKSSQVQNESQEKEMQYLTTTYNNKTDKAVLASLEKEKCNVSDLSDILEEI